MDLRRRADPALGLTGRVRSAEIAPVLTRCGISPRITDAVRKFGFAPLYRCCKEDTVDLTQQSLLIQVREGQPQAWQRFHEIYRPFIEHWLRSLSVPHQDVADLAQDVLVTILEQLPTFQHSGNPGAFRAWLRTVSINRARLFWRGQTHEPSALGGSTFLNALHELKDPDSGMTAQWNRDYQRHVVNALLAGVAQEFEPATVEAFRRLALEDETPVHVAEVMGMTVGALYVAKSRVLRRLRDLAGDMLD
jgi:RNA polymerase sigma-70 factor (ECF subfamily)